MYVYNSSKDKNKVTLCPKQRNINSEIKKKCPFRKTLNMLRISIAIGSILTEKLH